MAQIKDLKRMCEFHSGCSKCNLHDGYESCGVCDLPDNIDEIVDKWTEEHPVKTYAMDFFEKFPNAPKDDIGLPKPCVTNIYEDLEMKCDICSCSDCWNQEMKGE